MPPETLGRLSFLDRSLYTYTFLAGRSAMCMYVFRRSFSTVHPTLRRQGYPLRHPREGNFLLAWIVPFIMGYYCLLDIVRRTHNIYIPHGCIHTVQYDYELVDLL